MKTYRIDISSIETPVTAATWDSSCGVAPQDFTHVDDASFRNIVADGHWTFDNNQIKFTASTNDSTSMREGYSTISYKVNGVTCVKRTHIVQAAPGTDCTCSNITSFPSTYGGETMFIEFIGGLTESTMDYSETCNMYIDMNGVDWVTVVKKNNKLKFTVSEQVTEYRSGTMYIKTSAAGTVCKTIVIEQYPNETCECSDLTWKIPTYQANYVELSDLEIDECDGTFGISYNVKKKSDNTLVYQINGGWEEQDISETVQCSPDDGSPNLTDEDRAYNVLIEPARACECESSDLEVTYIQPPCYTGCATVDIHEEHQGQEPDEHWHTWVITKNNVGDEYDGYAKIKLRSYQNGSSWNDYISEDIITVHSGVGNQFDLGIFNGSYTGFFIQEVLYACDRKGRRLEPCD